MITNVEILTIQCYIRGQTYNAHYKNINEVGNVTQLPIFGFQEIKVHSFSVFICFKHLPLNNFLICARSEQHTKLL